MEKLLIIDSSSLITNVLKDMFEKHNNFTLFIAKSYEEANAIIKKQKHSKFFCAISNLVLPDALNAEILELLEKNKIPIVVLTSNIDEKNLQIIKSKNIVDYFFKDSLSQLHAVYELVELLLFIENKKILVVEDSKSSATLIQTIAKSLFLDVKITTCVSSALEVLEEDKNISLIITDYNMSPMNGLDLIKQVHKNDYNSHIPIIVISSSDTKDLKIKLYKNGAKDFLNKPVLEEELKTKLIDIFSSLKNFEEIKEFNTIFDNQVISSSADKHGNIKSVSEAFCNISGYTKEELIGKPHSILRHPDMESSIFEDLWKNIKTGETWKGEIKNRKKDGSFYWVNVIIKANFDNNSIIRGYTSVREDITDKKRIYDLAIRDGLTSLYNRRHFNDVAPVILENAIRNNDVFAFILLDIDNFKKYNDTYGHQEGDRALINVSQSLKNTFKRINDLVYRLGGEEFGILLTAKSRDDIAILCEKTRQNIENLNIEHVQNIPYRKLTVSLGTIILDANKENVKLDVIYKKADEALYRAKQGGRNKVVYCATC